VGTFDFLGFGASDKPPGAVYTFVSLRSIVGESRRASNVIQSVQQRRLDLAETLVDGVGQLSGHRSTQSACLKGARN
jgi:hypothetical protein